MFQVYRLKNLKILKGKWNDISIRPIFPTIFRTCSGSTSDLEQKTHKESNEAIEDKIMKHSRVGQETEKIKGQLTLKQQVKEKRLKRNPNHADLDALSREELVEMIRRLNEANKHLVSAIKKGSEDKTENKKKTLYGPYKRHILIRICYLGWNFRGFVIQNNINNTIEDHLFSALINSSLIESRQTSKYHSCGRTDNGVSAFGQVISIDVKSAIKPQDQFSRAGIENEIRYCGTLNSMLPKQIRAIAWRPLLSNEYSARFDCDGRTYKYYFHRGDLNVEMMQEACQYFIGTHDFRNFCKDAVMKGVVNHIRRLDSVEIKPVAPNHEQVNSLDVFCLDIKGLSFLWHMVRNIVSILMMVGKGNESPDIVKKLLDVEVNDRKPNYELSSELPLNLFKCDFHEETPEAGETRDMEILNKWIYNEKEMKYLITELQKEWCKESIKSTMLYEMLKELRAEYFSRYPKATDVPIYENGGWGEYKTVLDRQKSPSIEDRMQNLRKMLEKS